MSVNVGDTDGVVAEVVLLLGVVSVLWEVRGDVIVLVGVVHPLETVDVEVRSVVVVNAPGEPGDVEVIVVTAVVGISVLRGDELVAMDVCTVPVVGADGVTVVVGVLAVEELTEVVVAGKP